jgi:hypothetical protein
MAVAMVDEPFQSNSPFPSLLHVPQRFLRAPQHLHSAAPYRSHSEQLFTMSGDSYRTLWCLVAGDPTSFELNVPASVG